MHRQTTQIPNPDAGRRSAFMERVFNAMVTTSETQCAYLGMRLGFYEALREGGPATPGELAQRAGTDERYTQEWLEQQAVAGYLDVVGASADPAARRFALPPEHAEVLLDPDSLNYMGFVPLFTTATGATVPALANSFRTGEGVTWGSYGYDLWRAQGDQNRAFLRHVFAPQVLAAVKDLDARLATDPSARVADIACGVGWAAIAIAEHYPNVHVDGLDLDAEAVAAGREVVEERGLGHRVSLQVRDAADPDLGTGYALVTIVEALHDMAHPVAVLRAARRLLAPDGYAVIVDEKTLESFQAPGPLMERMFYGFSVLSCLATGRSAPDSAMTGAVMRPATLTRYAKEAGFRRVEVLDVPHDFFRVYILRP